MTKNYKQISALSNEIDVLSEEVSMIEKWLLLDHATVFLCLDNQKAYLHEDLRITIDKADRSLYIDMVKHYVKQLNAKIESNKNLLELAMNKEEK